MSIFHITYTGTEKETARALAEHEAQERKHALLELKHARDPA
jgi:hypothetical protein